MKPKLITSLLWAGLLLFPMNNSVQAQSKEIKEFCKGLDGTVYWLRIDVITVQRSLTFLDVTNLYPDGKVYYRGTLGDDSDQTRTQSADEFAAAVRQRAPKDRYTILKRGARVTVDYTSPRKDQVKVGLKGEGKAKVAIWLKFEEKEYTLEDLQKTLARAFAKSEADLAVTLKLGMSVEEVIEIKGAPKSRVDLGTKTILTYEDMKVTFEDNKLTNAE